MSMTMRDWPGKAVSHAIDRIDPQRSGAVTSDFIAETDVNPSTSSRRAPPTLGGA